MRLYSAGAILKILVGLGILTILYHYVNVYQDPAIGISFGFLGIFMIVRGVSYFVFSFCYRFFSVKPKYIQESMSYKLSLLIGLYVMMNLTLVITDHRSKLIGIMLLFLFIVIQTIFVYEKKREITY